MSNNQQIIEAIVTVTVRHASKHKTRHAFFFPFHNVETRVNDKQFISSNVVRTGYESVVTVVSLLLTTKNDNSGYAQK